MIQTILSILFLDVAFPIIFILSIFALFSLKKTPLNGLFRFIIIFFLLTLSFRILTYIRMAGAINVRYFYTLVFPFILLSVSGFSYLAEYCQRQSRTIHGKEGSGKEHLKRSNLDLSKPFLFFCKHVRIILILVIALPCIAKALSCPDHKDYIKEVVQTIKASDKRAVLFFDETKDGQRIAYHAKVDSFPLSTILNNKPENLGDALSILESKNIKAFVFIGAKDKDFRKLFDGKKIRFPLNLIKEYKEKHTYFSLYVHNPNN